MTSLDPMLRSRTKYLTLKKGLQEPLMYSGEYESPYFYESKAASQYSGFLLNDPRRSTLLLNRMKAKKELRTEYGFTYSRVTKMMSSSHRASPEEIIGWLDSLVAQGVLSRTRTFSISNNNLCRAKNYYRFTDSYS